MKASMKWVCKVVALVALCVAATSEDSRNIAQLGYKDSAFVRYQQQVEQSQKDAFRGQAMQPAFFCYKGQKGDTVFTVSSRCSIRQETFATANSIASSEDTIEGRLLYLSTANGLFIATSPETSIDFLLEARFKEDIAAGKFDTVSVGDKSFYFVPNEKFSPAERLYFLTPGIQMPLEKSTLTSDYGRRQSPITGNWQFHRGIDLAAPLGSPVLACKSGTVKSFKKNDRVYGNCIVIAHANGIESLYAHLGEVLVNEGEVVFTGQTIGHVGLTGMTTGPHLHFEIKRDGESVNPHEYF